MPVEMPWMCQRNRLDLQCPQPQNPRSRAGGRPETPESIAVDFGSPSAAPDGVRASRAEAAPGSLGRTRQSRAGKGGEGSGSGAAPPGGDGLQEGGDSRPHEVKGAARIVLGGGQPRGGQQSLVLSCISLLP